MSNKAETGLRRQSVRSRRVGLRRNGWKFQHELRWQGSHLLKWKKLDWKSSKHVGHKCTLPTLFPFCLQASSLFRCGLKMNLSHPLSPCTVCSDSGLGLCEIEVGSWQYPAVFCVPVSIEVRDGRDIFLKRRKSLKKIMTNLCFLIYD